MPTQLISVPQQSRGPLSGFQSPSVKVQAGVTEINVTSVIDQASLANTSNTLRLSLLADFSGGQSNFELVSAITWQGGPQFNRDGTQKTTLVSPAFQFTCTQLAGLFALLQVDMPEVMDIGATVTELP